MDKLEEAVEVAKEFNFTISSFYILGDGIQKLFNLFDPVSKETRTRLLDLADKYSVSFDASRIFTSNTYTVFTRIIGRKIKVDPKTGKEMIIYYTDHGLYTAFYCKCVEEGKKELHPVPISVHGREFTNEPLRETTIFGPTCDSVDCLGKDFQLPLMEIGDWLKFEDCGYKCRCCSSHFNGFTNAEVIVIDN